VIAFFYVDDFLPHLCNDAAALMAEVHWPRQRGAAQLVHLGIANTAREVSDRDLVPPKEPVRQSGRADHAQETLRPVERKHA
jgi:hypothetical protein